MKNLKNNVLLEVINRVTYSINDVNCWICTSHKCNNLIGHYPRISIKGKLYTISRLFYMIYNGKLKSNDLVLHTCDNPACINPKHLFKGTYKDNNQDRMIKGRSKPRKGSKNGRAKLSEKDVIYIFNNPDYLSIFQCMIKFKVSRPTIEKIRSGETWKTYKMILMN